MIGEKQASQIAEQAVVTSGGLALHGGRLRAVLTPLLALFTALVVCGMLLALTGHNPLTVYGVLWSGAVTGPAAFANTLISTTPYILLGLGLALGFKAGLFNIGAEGQYVVGGIGAAWAGHLFNGAPAILMVLFTLLAGTQAGALYASIVGILKVTSGAHEVITTIMLNYVAYKIVTLLVNLGGIMNGNPQIPESPAIYPGAQLPVIWSGPGAQLDAGLFVALAGAVVVYVLLSRTTWGFQLRAVGLNPPAARSAGISIRRITISVMAVSGALCGLSGAIQVSGQLHVLQDPFNSGFGFDAIAVAIIGANNPFGIVLAALLLGGLRNSSTTLEASAGISGPFVNVIEALILFFVAAPVIIQWLYLHWWQPRSGKRVA